jgi:PAS domain S-box-containing protein
MNPPLPPLADPASDPTPAPQGRPEDSLRAQLRELSDRARMARRSADAAELRATLVARSMGMGTWEVDLTTGVATWDEQMWRLRGLAPRAEPLGHAERLALVHPDEQAPMRKMYQDAEPAGLPTEMEFRVRLPDGQWRWLASRTAQVCDEAGRPARRIGVNWDITDAREAAQLREERRLAQLESEAKSRLLARMSHELRTPLNAVLGFAQLLAADPSLGERPRGQVAQVLAAGEQLLALVDQVLDQAHQPANPPAQPAAGQPPSAGSAVHGGEAQRRVLYIEDNEVNAVIVRELLARRTDLALEVAQDGRSGVQRALSGRPDLVLVDMQLPDFDGIEVLRRLRAHPRGTALRCIALSANAAPEDIQAAREAGFADYWTKPLDFRRFNDAIDAIFGAA